MKDTDISYIDFKNVLEKLIMKPNKSVIYFTVFTGMGYGMIIVLSLLIPTKLTSLTLNIKLYYSIISFLLIASGLLALRLYLDYPKKIWQTISHWKHSWFSRKALFTIITFIPLTVFYFSWIILNNEILTNIFLIISAIFAILTIYCTSKIYSSLKAVPAWYNPFVTVLYILNGLVSGSLILFLIFYYFKIESYFLHNFIIIILPTTLFLKLLYWYSINKQESSNHDLTNEIKNKNNTKIFGEQEREKNYLTFKMIKNINRSKSFSYRSICIILTYICPVYCLLQIPSLVVNHEISVITYSISTILAISGMLLERWLFFLESKHF